MVTPTISIIIPVYNAGPYIEQCIRSVLDQTIREIEIIAVNDGSTDRSAALLDTIAATDVRLRVFHRSNSGVSATRNFGLQQATGTYIGFCDADDWMAPNMLEELHTALTYNNCDWAICNVRVIQDGKPEKVRLNLTDQVIDIAKDRAAFVHGLMRFQYDNANWNKLFTAALIRQKDIRFEEAMCIGEDLLFNLEYLQIANTAAIVSKPLYNYRILSTSLYSGQSADRLPQFNLLYKSYLDFAATEASLHEAEAFKAEMARITYNQLLYQLEVKVKTQNPGFMKVWRGYYNELKRFDPGIFHYPSSERTGVQGIKKQLLQNRRFGLFALVIASKTYLKKPYKFVRRLL